MWLIIGTVTFVVLFQLCLNIAYTAVANAECTFDGLSNEANGWFTQFFCRPINYVYWLFSVVYIFWPVEFKETYLPCWFKRVDEDEEPLLTTDDVKPMEIKTIDFEKI
jgi:hypothetical protein